MKFKTVNPATNEILAEYDTISKEETLDIAKQSHEAFKDWKNLSIKERTAYIKKLGQVLRENKQEYAEMMTKEMGKTITQSIAEVEKCAWLCDVMTEKAHEWLKDEEVEADGKKHLITYEPLGTVYIIMPWNYPWWQPIKVALPLMAAGNTALLKHARNVTGCALLVEDAFKKAGFPENVFRTIIIDHDTSAALVDSDYVQACSLTGSVSAGSKIAEQAGKNIKKVVLELGGSDPLIVLDDVDIEQAAQGAVLGRTSNAGQVCIGSKRIIVHQNVAEEFTSKFTEAVKALKLGDPMDPETEIGPLVNEKAVEDMEAFVEDAKQKGAHILTGGKRPEGLNGAYFEPTILGNPTKDMDAVCKETFGPIAPIIIVDSDEEAIEVANDSEFGLSATIWSRDLERAQAVGKKINTGAIFINSISKSHPLLPIGGIMKSGYGRELSHIGIKEFTNIKTVNVYESEK